MTDEPSADPPPPLTYEKTAVILARLADLDEPIVLIGGQAVNFWAEHYLAHVPELATRAPYASKDIDFCAAPAAVVACATRLGGKAFLAGLADRRTAQGLEHMGTPNTGKVTFVDDDGIVREIDFLQQPAGLTWTDTLETSFPATILDQDQRPIASFRVMHPVLSLESRAYNVAYLPGYQTDHARDQLRAAIVCAREFVRDILAGDEVRRALRLNERIYKIARYRAGPLVYVRDGIDVFEGVLVDPALPRMFLDRRYPQMREDVDRQRVRTAAAERITRGDRPLPVT